MSEASSSRAEILSRLQAGEMSIEEATRLLDELPKKPPDLPRRRAVGHLLNRLSSLEEVEITAKLYTLQDVEQWLAGGDWLSSTMPFLSTGMCLRADVPGEFKNEVGERKLTVFEAPREDDGVRLQVGNIASMTLLGLFGTTHRDVYVSIELRLVPRPNQDGDGHASS